MLERFKGHGTGVLGRRLGLGRKMLERGSERTHDPYELLWWIGFAGWVAGDGEFEGGDVV